MEAPKVPTLDLKGKRKPGTAAGSVPMATDGDDDRNLSVIDPGGDYGQQQSTTDPVRPTHCVSADCSHSVTVSVIITQSNSTWAALSSRRPCSELEVFCRAQFTDSGRVEFCCRQINI